MEMDWQENTAQERNYAPAYAKHDTFYVDEDVYKL